MSDLTDSLNNETSLVPARPSEGVLAKWKPRIEKYIAMVRNGLDSSEKVFPGTKQEIDDQIGAVKRVVSLTNNVVEQLPNQQFIKKQKIEDRVLTDGGTPQRFSFDFKNTGDWHIQAGEHGLASAGGMIAKKSGDDITTLDVKAMYEQLSQIKPDTGLTVLEQMFAETFSQSGGYEFLSESNYPTVYREFSAICRQVKDNPAAKKDKYVRRYLKEHDNEPMMPRVVVLDSKELQAMSADVPFSPEPLLFITCGLLEKSTSTQAANVLRHELGHAYKQARRFNIIKKLAVTAIPFYKSSHKEEDRCDVFAPRNGDDLRSLAAALDDLGDVFHEMENRYRAVLNIVLKQGVADAIIDDLLNDGRQHLDSARQKMRNAFAEKFSAVLSEEGQAAVRQVPESSIVTKAAEKIGRFAKGHVTRKLEKVAASPILLEEGEVSPHLAGRKTVFERDSATHPAIGKRTTRLRSRAGKLDAITTGNDRGDAEFYRVLNDEPRER